MRISNSPVRCKGDRKRRIRPGKNQIRQTLTTDECDWPVTFRG